jgi:hypothetical protein
MSFLLLDTIRRSQTFFGPRFQFTFASFPGIRKRLVSGLSAEMEMKRKLYTKTACVQALAFLLFLPFTPRL